MVAPTNPTGGPPVWKRWKKKRQPIMGIEELDHAQG